MLSIPRAPGCLYIASNKVTRPVNGFGQNIKAQRSALAGLSPSICVEYFNGECIMESSTNGDPEW